MAVYQSKTPVALKLWLWFGAYWSCAGWVLSALHALNPVGYGVALVAGGIGIAIFRRSLFDAAHPALSWRKAKRRFRRLFPFCFLFLAGLAILGGVLFHPANPDALTQRMPRVLNWLAESRWHWTTSTPATFNTRACGFEWLLAPMLALLRTDRWIFLYNALSYLLMPGLVFGVLTHLQVGRRVAWYWMWLAPTGYCFLMQAGSICNDGLGAVYSLAAIDLALRARKQFSYSQLWLSALALALATGTKTSNLPLCLPWLLAAWPALKALLQRPLATFAVACVAIGASFVPTAVLNYYYCHDWTGAAYELTSDQAHASPPVAVIGNALNLAAQNLAPPIFPAAAWWNSHAYNWIPQRLLASMEQTFEAGGAHLQLPEIQFEVAAGLGCGITILALLSWLAGWWYNRASGSRNNRVPARGLLLVRVSFLLCVLVYMVKLTMSTSGRIIAPYYCLVLPTFLLGCGQRIVVRQLWWRFCSLAVFALALVMIVINPPRPLWPGKTVLASLSASHPDSRPLRLGCMVYEAYADRWDALAPVRNYFPESEKNVGLISFITTTTLETSLWRPFGSRRIHWFRPEASTADIAAKGIRYVIIGTDPAADKATMDKTHEWLEQWLAEHQAKLLAAVPVRLVATREPARWYVTELPSLKPATIVAKSSSAPAHNAARTADFSVDARIGPLLHGSD